MSDTPTIREVSRSHLKWMLIDDIGPTRFTNLLKRFGDAETALGASASQLAQTPRVSQKMADQIARQRDSAALREAVELEIEAAAERGVRIISRADAEYPVGLRQADDPPIVLYVLGELRPEDAVAVAIVGSRRCTIYGSEQARRFGELLAAAGFTVVSGLARGIDAFAHHGAVDAGGRSVAVLGNGLSSIYPPENQALSERIIRHGACVSELPMRATVRASNFHSRNRIIAGMSLGTLVVEAAARSGALITAKLAREYNREVFAIPGRVSDATALGVNALIRDGAKLVMSLEDIIGELGEIGAALRERSPLVKSAGVASKAGAATTADPLDSAAERENANSSTDCENGEAATGCKDGALATGREYGASATGRESIASPLARAKVAEGSELQALQAEFDFSLTPEQRAVYEAVNSDPQTQDAVLSAVGLPPGVVLSALTTLELRGLIRRLPGQLVARRGAS